jgi:hypothetical protein
MNGASSSLLLQTVVDTLAVYIDVYGEIDKRGKIWQKIHRKTLAAVRLGPSP